MSTIDLTSQTTIPLNHFISLLPTIPFDEEIVVTGKATNTAIKRALVFAGLSIRSTQIADDATTYTIIRPNKNKTQAKPIETASSTTAAPAQNEFAGWGIDPTKTASTVDETELLKDTVTETAQFDCGTGTGPKKACKNCTCGLADQEVADAQSQQEKKEGTGGCGSCSLGDAYRCAGCPSLGKPAWKTIDGENIKINTEDPTVQ